MQVVKLVNRGVASNVRRADVVFTGGQSANTGVIVLHRDLLDFVGKDVEHDSKTEENNAEQSKCDHGRAEAGHGSPSGKHLLLEIRGFESGDFIVNLFPLLFLCLLRHSLYNNNYFELVNSDKSNHFMLIYVVSNNQAMYSYQVYGPDSSSPFLRFM